jgi:hypothetical protein
VGVIASDVASDSAPRAAAAEAQTSAGVGRGPTRRPEPGHARLVAVAAFLPALAVGLMPQETVGFPPFLPLLCAVLVAARWSHPAAGVAALALAAPVLAEEHLAPFGTTTVALPVDRVQLAFFLIAGLLGCGLAWEARRRRSVGSPRPLVASGDGSV